MVVMLFVAIAMVSDCLGVQVMNSGAPGNRGRGRQTTAWLLCHHAKTAAISLRPAAG
jgi:hypothetical protein